jgi:hypothetical protein
MYVYVYVLLIFKKANGVGAMTNLMLPLKNGIPDMEIKKHQWIVFYITAAMQDGLTTLVKGKLLNTYLTNNNNQKNKYGLVVYCINIIHATC